MKGETLLDGTGERLDVLKTALSVLYAIRGKAADGASYCKEYLYVVLSVPASTPTLIAFDDCLH